MIDYTTMSGRNTFVKEAFLKRKFEDRLVDILQLVKEGDRILEVGCAEGMLCQYLKAKRSVHFTGIEPSLDRRVASIYLDEVHPTIAMLKDTSEYDLVISFHTLEHIENPLAELRSWRRLLRKKGRLVVEVPNGPGHPDILSDNNPEHINVFKASTLSDIVESAGFEVERLTRGHFESPLYPDSLRIIATLDKPHEERLGRLSGRFKNIPPPLGLFGIGGDFFKFLAPILNDLLPVALLDSDRKPRKKNEFFINPQVYENSSHKHLNIVITTFRFEEEILSKLVDSGHPEEKIFLLSRILLD